MTQVIARIADSRYRTEVQIGRHSLVADEPEAMGGADEGPAPYDLILCGLGVCTAVTLRMYADSKGWPASAVEVALQLRRAASGMKIARSITLTGLDDSQRARLLDISERTPVTLTLKSGIAIETTLA